MKASDQVGDYSMIEVLWEEFNQFGNATHWNKREKDHYQRLELRGMSD